MINIAGTSGTGLKNSRRQVDIWVGWADTAKGVVLYLGRCSLLCYLEPQKGGYRIEFRALRMFQATSPRAWSRVSALQILFLLAFLLANVEPTERLFPGRTSV